ncbi:MAG: hypothetical protein LBK52_07840, partial [Deltaproteobacteria bacterium]|nr:hypothetical protein [Deltaproteobacteria bacterium]
AVLRFDPKKGPFVNYISSCLNNTCKGFRKGGTAVDLPSNTYWDWIKVKKDAISFENKYGRPPSAEESSARTGLEVSKIKKLPPDLGYDVNLDAPVSSDSQDSAVNNYPDPQGKPASELAFSNEDRCICEKLLKLLPYKLEYIIRHLYGFAEPMTLAQIGKELGLSGERVRQLSDKALLQLRDLMRDQYPDLVQGEAVFNDPASAV